MSDREDPSRKSPQSWLFPVVSTTSLRHWLNAAGDGARFFAYTEPGDGITFLKLRVIPAEGSALAQGTAWTDINESHPCPPFTDCPGGG